MNPPSYQFLIAVAAFIALALFLGYGVREGHRRSQAIYAGLDALRDRAKAARSRAELDGVWRDLVAFSNKHIWHRAHGAEAREVAAYIRGKYEQMT